MDNALPMLVARKIAGVNSTAPEPMASQVERPVMTSKAIAAKPTTVLMMR